MTHSIGSLQKSQSHVCTPFYGVGGGGGGGIQHLVGGGGGGGQEV